MDVDLVKSQWNLWGTLGLAMSGEGDILIDPGVFREVILERGRLCEVVADIHQDDFIFQFLITNPSFLSREDAINYYFTDGKTSAEKLKALISEFLQESSDGAVSILEFASGYGCVSRHLLKDRDYTVTPCDIHPAAIAFLSEKLGLEPLLSAHRPEEFAPAKHYDVVFALSFFSHMPDATWGRWLAALFKVVKPGGLLIFTTQGRMSRKFFGDPALDGRGYWFRAESEQKDLDVAEYGQTIVTSDYVFSMISALPQAELCFFQQAHWWRHQDTYVVRRTDR